MQIEEGRDAGGGRCMWEVQMEAEVEVEVQCSVVLLGTL